MIRVQLLHRNHCWICLLDIRRRKFVALKEVIAGKSINAALFRGRRSLKKFDLKCGAHSGAALNRGGAQTSKYGICVRNISSKYWTT
jgi:hypothetical protein